ncbi:MAG: OmpA family protein [Flavobacteriia bacterium]|nr:OmpA family protein [Flavobacteriia bacterium]
MKWIYLFITLLSVAISCVPAKKYNDLVAREKQCSDELEKYKSSSLDFEGKFKDIEAKHAVLSKEVANLKADTNDLGNKYRILQTQYDKIVDQNEVLETKYDKLRLSGAKETSLLQSDIEAKNLELQRKEDALDNLEKELNGKLKLLADREQRVNELEEMIKRKDDAVMALKTKVANALKGFENKGLTVVHKNGKIYVSLEAKLLFKTGSTAVEEEGKKALIELAKVLEHEKDIEIIVEGHTDTDKLASPASPKNNWELSVLRSTSVVDIMIANSKMNPAQLMAAGRSEFHPVDSQDKAKNRRIEIIISPNLNELFEIINK